MPLSAPDGWHDLLAEDAAGGCVVLRVPPDLDGVAAIRQEADLAKRHPHESLVQSVGLVEHNGWPIQILEHIDGLNIEQLTAWTGPLAAPAICRIGRQVALGLVELHDRAPVLCHGSLGPDRVIVDDGGNARLVDVGVARPSSKKRFVSPERRRTWAKPSAADDLWALGVLLADAALGEARIVDDRLELSPVVKLALPERLIDALTILVAPIESRVKNANAAVRIFTELELRFTEEAGRDGASSLRDAMKSARDLSRLPANDDKSSDRHDITIPDAGGSPTLPPTILFSVNAAPTSPSTSPTKDASAEELGPNTLEINLNPKTVNMDGGALDLVALRRMAALAEAATRGEELGANLPKTTSTTAPPVTQPKGPMGTARIEDDLAPDELEAVGAGAHGKLIAGIAVGAAMLMVAFVLGAWLG